MNVLSLQIRNLVFILLILFLSSCEKQYTTKIDSTEDVINSESQNRYPNKIALTFDDGPDKVYTELILNILRDKNVKATFFLIGNKMMECPTVTKRIFSEGHCIANHTRNHFKLPGKSFKEVYKNMMWTEKIIDSVCGGSLKLFRPPFGKIRKEQRDNLSKYGFKVIMWDINSKDYDKKYSPDRIVNKVISEARNQAIVLFHSADYAGKESRTNTVEALPKIIDLLKSKGYSFVKINEIVTTSLKYRFNENFIPDEDY